MSRNKRVLADIRRAQELTRPIAIVEPHRITITDAPADPYDVTIGLWATIRGEHIDLAVGGVDKPDDGVAIWYGRTTGEPNHIATALAARMHITRDLHDTVVITGITTDIRDTPLQLDATAAIIGIAHAAECPLDITTTP